MAGNTVVADVLGRGRRRLRRPAEQIPALVWTTDSQLRITWAIGAGVVPLDVEPAQVVGVPVELCFQGKGSDSPPVAAHRRALEGESVCFGHDWGGHRYRGRVSPLWGGGRQGERQIVGCIGFAQEITEHGQAQQELQKASGELQRQLGKRVRELTCVYDMSYLLGGPGISLEEIFQRTVELIPPAWQYPEITWLQQHRDESRAFTAIAKERGQFQEWIDTFDTFVGKFDPNGVVIFCNEAPLKAGGLSKDDVFGKYFPDTKWWSHSEIERARIVECLQRAKTGLASRLETNFRSANGTPVPIIFNCQPVMDHDGKVKYITAEGKTVIEEMRLRSELQQAREALEIQVRQRTSELVEANERLGQENAERKRAEGEAEKLVAELAAKNAELAQFTYTVSHDLKSPLITIQGFLGQLQKDIAEGKHEQMKADMARIHKAAERMHRFLDELLELSRIGRVADPSEELSLSELAREAVDLVAGPIAERGVAVEISPDLPVVFGDRRRLSEVLQNLIENAVKFMGDQPQPRIEIGSRQEGEEAVCYVRDNGLGIPPRYHSRVFELFDKLDPESRGTGFGLALVKRIVDVHGGRTWVESEGKGQGSTFCFVIPSNRESANRDKRDDQRAAFGGPAC